MSLSRKDLNRIHRRFLLYFWTNNDLLGLTMTFIERLFRRDSWQFNLHYPFHQDPDLMAEAKKMMENPAFQKQMKEMSGDKAFQDSIKKSVEMMKDPARAAEMEAKMEHMMKVGNQQLKDKAGNLMEDAMAAMNNPEVMAEVAKMVKDPNFQQQLADMAKDPQFKSYIDAMKDMANDPAKKRQMEAIAQKMMGAEL